MYDQRLQYCILLVQCLWRCYAAECRSRLSATWMIHVEDSSTSGGHRHHHRGHNHNYRQSSRHRKLAKTLQSRFGWRSTVVASGSTGLGSTPFSRVFRKPDDGDGITGVIRSGSRPGLLDGAVMTAALMCHATMDVRVGVLDASTGNDSKTPSCYDGTVNVATAIA